jgi:hypothetical protein
VKGIERERERERGEGETEVRGRRGRAEEEEGCRRHPVTPVIVFASGWRGREREEGRIWNENQEP